MDINGQNSTLFKIEKWRYLLHYYSEKVRLRLHSTVLSNGKPRNKNWRLGQLDQIMFFFPYDEFMKYPPSHTQFLPSLKSELPGPYPPCLGRPTPSHWRLGFQALCQHLPSFHSHGSKSINQSINQSIYQLIKSINQ